MAGKVVQWICIVLAVMTTAIAALLLREQNIVSIYLVILAMILVAIALCISIQRRANQVVADNHDYRQGGSVGKIHWNARWLLDPRTERPVAVTIMLLGMVCMVAPVAFAVVTGRPIDIGDVAGCGLLGAFVLLMGLVSLAKSATPKIDQ